MTLNRDKNLHKAIAVSVAIHGIFLFYVAWDTLNHWQQGSQGQSVATVEKEVTLLFPEQILPAEPEPPPVVKPKPPSPPVEEEMKPFIRASQNEAAVTGPAHPAAYSNRNSVAASKKAPSPDATRNVPNRDGKATLDTGMVDRDFRNGEIKNDAAVKTPAVPKMLPPTPKPPVEVAKAESEKRPMLKMLEEVDRETTQLEMKTPKETPPTPATTPPPTQAKASPLPQMIDPVNRAATEPEKDSFSPLTRAGSVKGTVANKGDDALDLERTPFGGYVGHVFSALEKKWQVYRLLKKDAVTIGSMSVRFFVNKNGRVEDLKITSDPGNADPRFRELALRAIKDAELPPIPAELLPTLEAERVRVDYEFVIY